MEEASTKKNKTKPINIKNKKAVKATLAKASIKGKTTNSKKTTKTSTVKKKPLVTSDLTKVEIKALGDEQEKVVKEVKKVTTTKKATVKKEPKNLIKEYKKKKTTTVKEPNNILRKIPKEEKEANIEEPVVENQIIEEPKKESLEKAAKEIAKEEKRRKRLEKKKARQERKAKRKEEKLKLKEKKLREKKLLAEKELKEKKSKKDQKGKTKIEFPKEWKTINSKNDKTIKEEVPKTFKGKIKRSIFESIDEKELQERKKQSKESLKKTIIVFLIIAVIVGVIIYSLLKYNDFVKRQLAVYEPYRIGDSVRLQDDSVWYVIEDSDSREDKIKLLSTLFTDINKDGVVDAADLVKYNSTNSTDYNESDENSIAYYLNKTIKPMYADKIGHIEEISLLSSKEFVKVRERMNFGDEWSVPNWLANPWLRDFWILSDKNNKVYVATEKGTFYLSDPNKAKYIRPTIVVKKEIAKKIEARSRMTVDLINGLKRK